MGFALSIAENTLWLACLCSSDGLERSWETISECVGVEDEGGEVEWEEEWGREGR